MRDYEGLARAAVQTGNEGPKIDFKEQVDFESKRDVVELAKLALAMANTDSDECCDLGLIVIGARRKELLGGCDRFSQDSFCASIPTRLNQYIEPAARIETKGFQDSERGWFGVVVVKPNRAVRPHVIAKGFTDDKRAIVRKNECYVRNGESTELASRADLERMYTQRFGAELDRLREQADPEPVPRLTWDGAGFDGVIEVPPGGPYSLPAPDDPFLSEEMESFPPEFRAKAEAFNEARTQYLEAVRGAATQLEAAFHAEEHGNWLRVTLANQGEAPLFKILCFVTAPVGFSLYGGDSVPECAKLPSVPAKPRYSPPKPRVFETIDRLNELYRLGVFSDPGRVAYLNAGLALRDPRDGGFRSDGERKVRAWADRLKHGLTLQWSDPIVLVPPATEGLYSLDYVIHADNIRKAMTGRLEVRVRSGAERRPRTPRGADNS